MDDDLGRDAARGLDPVANGELDGQVVRLDLDREHVQLRRSVDDDPVLRAYARHGAERVLDHVGVDVDAADEQHVVDPAVDAVGEAPVGAPAGARLRRHAGEVPDQSRIIGWDVRSRCV